VSETLTKEQRAKRVAICQDVIDGIRLGLYTDSRETVGLYDYGVYLTRPHYSKAECARLPDEPCGVCARGALFVSKLRLFNEAPDGADFQGVDPVHDLFPDWASIEGAYERVDVHSSGVAPSVLGRYDNMPRFPDRLLAIMLDIISDDGALVR
jgi:hypothetical protein